MCINCEWDIYTFLIEEMMADKDFSFAEDTIESIYDWVLENKHITDGQKKAINNIKDSVENKER